MPGLLRRQRHLPVFSNSHKARRVIPVPPRLQARLAPADGLQDPHPRHCHLGLGLYLSHVGTLRSPVRHVEHCQAGPPLLGVCLTLHIRGSGFLHQPFCDDNSPRLCRLFAADAPVFPGGHPKEYAHRAAVPLRAWSCVCLLPACISKPSPGHRVS